MKIFRIVCGLAALFCFASALPAADAKAAISSHEQAARELYGMVGGQKLAAAAGSAMMVQFASNPELAPYKDILEGWIQKVYAGGAFDKEMVRIYAEAYSEDELRQLIAFYQTPIGRKTLQIMPELMQKGMAVGQKLAQEHLPELQQAIAARESELKAQEPKPAPQEQKPPR